MISTISFGLLLVALIALVIVPAFKEIRPINKQVLEERIRLEKLYLRGQLQRTVKITYDKVADDLPILDEMMLTEGQELQYITSLENMATQENVGLSINVGESKRVPEQKFSVLPFTFEVQGQWESILKWISKVENLHLYTNIIQGTIAVRDDPDNPEKERGATMTFTSDTFWQIP
jgi:hypothetical protein